MFPLFLANERTHTLVTDRKNLPRTYRVLEVTTITKRPKSPLDRCLCSESDSLALILTYFSVKYHHAYSLFVVVEMFDDIGTKIT